MQYLNQFLLMLSQISPENGAGGGDASETAAENSGGIFGGLGMFMLPMLMIMVVYFLLMSRPQQKQQAKVKDMLDNLKKNDRVVTAGGILGTVANSREDSEYITLRVDDSSNAKMQILKTSIIRVVSDDAEADEKSK